MTDHAEQQGLRGGGGESGAQVETVAMSEAAPAARCPHSSVCQQGLGSCRVSAWLCAPCS